MILLGSDSLGRARNDRLAKLTEHQISKPAMANVVSSISTGGNFFVETFKNSWM